MNGAAPAARAKSKAAVRDAPSDAASDAPSDAARHATSHATASDAARHATSHATNDAADDAAQQAREAHRERRGFALGVLGVTIFALTLPMTRLAVGDVSSPQLAPAFVTAGRAALAGFLSIAYLLWARADWPARRHWRALAVCALGTVVGFPLFLALALREVDAMHGAVVTGVLPLGTAVAAALLTRQRASAAFWVCALIGCALVLAFAAQQGGGALSAADGLLLLAVASASVGYVAGARVSSAMPAEHTICWVLVLSLPLTLPVTLWVWPSAPASIAAWGGFLYVAVFSMWLGFFAWYRALSLGGVMRVSQVQLLQPFLTLLFAAALLGEQLEPSTVAFALAVVAVVFVGKKLPNTPIATTTASATATPKVNNNNEQPKDTS